MFEKLLKKIDRVLRHKDIPYMVIGGQAVLVYGEPRMTRDIDITLGISLKGVEKVIEVVKECGLQLLVDNPEEFAGKTMVLPSAEKESSIRVDFILSFSDYERQAIERAVEVEVEGQKIKYASLEDILIHKLLAGRSRDIADARNILLKNPNPDREYIMRWLGEFDRTLEGSYRQDFNELIASVEERNKP